MINYELAKELKNAGFPQNFTGECESGCNVANKDLTDYVYSPTLSELIEACGECLSHIKRLPVGGKEYWWAVSHCGHEEHEFYGNNLEEQGSTPEEAVAKLWLELNTKNKEE